MDILELDPSVAVHKMNIKPNVKRVMQKKRMFSPERKKVIAKVINKLKVAIFIREVQFLIWLSNMVVVKKGK